MLGLALARMHRIGKATIDAYLADDVLAEQMRSTRRPGDGSLTCQRWLDATPAKRYAAQALYGDLLQRDGLRVLDIGGGLTTFTREVARRHRLTLVDLMAHDDNIAIDAFLTSAPAFELVRRDWLEALAGFDGKYDVVVAADLFPNVDQRLQMFLDRALPIAGEIRLSLTYYNEPRYYLTRRIEADEVLCMLAWDGAQTQRVLEGVRGRISGPDFSIFSAREDSVYGNGRQVALVRMFGNCRQ